MANITEFQEWLDMVSVKTDEEVYNLYDSVTNFEQSGAFYTHKEVTNDGYQYFISAEGVLDKLFLDSDQTKFDFIEYLAQNYTDAEEGDVQKWYNLKKEVGRVD
ncbi:hypothetical protein [Dyadobacter luticola]|uniref:Uncharacterized protein n=1 Tax=Dyadobacter luticola TaxID=1979387 RepID=A0A5R9L6S2_9BACT|nr:hypothetical protein [Dyadobacter luticola]TLV03970.1 hypothetical protein FEN17_10425 [Dyadobacter luticola]